MESIVITFLTMLIGKCFDEMAFRYNGKKYPKMKKYIGLFGWIAQMAARRK